MSLLERSICKITALNADGLGVGVSDTSLNTVEIPYCLPGEVIEFEKHCYRNKTSFLLTNILQTSKNRSRPDCKYFGTCGGCSLQHLKPNYYLQYKLDILQKLLTKHDIITFPRLNWTNDFKGEVREAYIGIGENTETRQNPLDHLKMGNGITTTIIHPIKSIGSASRRRAILEAVKKQNRIFLGFKKFHSDKIVDIDGCPVVIPQLSALIDKLKPMLLQLLDDRQKCKLLVTKADNGIVLTLELKKTPHQGEGHRPTTGTLKKKDDEALKNFCQENDIIKLTIIDGDKWNVAHLDEPPYITFEGVKVAIENHSFLQVSSLSDQILADLINNIFSKINQPDIGQRKLQIVDLFCGRGTLTIPATKFGAVDGFESEKSSVKALNEAINCNIFQRDLFATPLTWSELNKYDVAIINPPRAGAKEQSTVLSSSTVKTIIYLSCNPESFTRDAKIILRGNRYSLTEITPIDQFYWSHHLEIMGVFKLV